MLGGRAVRQYGVLVSAQAAGLLLSFVLTMVLTHGLSVTDYGMLRYIITFLALGSTVMQFGWPYSAARLLALTSERQEQKQIVGAATILLISCTGLGVLATAAGRQVAVALGYEAPAVLLVASAFLYVTLGPYVITYVCQGLNRISVLSFLQVAPRPLLRCCRRCDLSGRACP